MGWHAYDAATGLRLLAAGSGFVIVTFAAADRDLLASAAAAQSENASASEVVWFSWTGPIVSL